jgi:hypothetical protein
VISALALALAPARAAGAVAHMPNWATRGQSVVCGVAAQVPGTAVDPGTMAPENGRWPGVQCTAPGIPRPRQGVGDPFVQLGQGRSGRARLRDESQDELISASPFVELAAGATWRRYGIACTVGSASVRCVNSAGSGFSIALGHVRVF